MASNQLHPSNPYRDKPPDFGALRALYPHLLANVIPYNPYLTSQPKIDWSNPATLHAITKVLLLHDFQLEWDGLAGHLCPPLPNRLNYLCWLNDLIQSSQALWPKGLNNVSIVDIGVGANAIYPLLGAKMFGWSFAGSDINPTAVAHAQSLLDRNPAIRDKICLIRVASSEEMQNQLQAMLEQPNSSAMDEDSGSGERKEGIIQIDWLQEKRGPIRQAWASLGEAFLHRLADCEYNLQPNRRDSMLTGQASKRMRLQSSSNEGAAQQVAQETCPSYTPLLTAVMTNPPFYDISEQIQPMSADGEMAGCSEEMRTLGGELAFVAAMIADSLVLRGSVLWYTAMVGKKSSVAVLKALLCREGLSKEQIFCTTFCQGVTHRWAIAWTFHAPAARLYQTQSMLIARPVTDHPAAHSVSERKYSYSLRTSCGRVLETSLPTEMDGSPALLVAARRVLLLSQQLEAVLSSQHYYHNYLPRTNSDAVITANGVVQSRPWNLSIVQAAHGASPEGQISVRLDVLATLDPVLAQPTSAGLGDDSRRLLFVLCIQVRQDSQDDIVADLSLESVSCPESFASRIFSRITEFFEADFLRANRKWRRQLQSVAQSYQLQKL